ncbi:uncharacterized protein DS421_12g380330 [Arachis hypogaea]|nr:uncharacterized protein DS421_12g380330 [Arachis hypogaea]
MPGTVNSGEDLEATHLAATEHAGEAELLRVPYHQRRLHYKTPPAAVMPAVAGNRRQIKPRHPYPWQTSKPPENSFAAV